MLRNGPMLRILVISLFVANLLLFGFQRSNPAVEAEPTASPTVKKNSSVPTIHLFAEMMQDQGLLTGNRQCFSLGPFHSGEDKDEVRLLLQEVSTRISERQTEALVEKGYWIFIPPYGSLLEANQALISLQALGLEDLGVVFDGDWKNAISLGYFMRQENAQRRKKSLESKGYAPLMRVQRQGEPRYWLDYEQNPGSSLIALDMQNRPNDFMQRSLPCPEDDVVEFAGAGSQEPAQVTAQLQVPEDNNEPASGRSEDLDIGGDIESVPQEQVETLPDQAVGTSPEQAVETETKAVIGTGQEDAVETEAENAVRTGSGDAIEPEPENAVGTGQEDEIETEAENTVGIGQLDVIESEPENAVVTGQEDSIDTEAENAVGIGQLDVIEPEAENAVGIGQLDVIESEPENAVVTGQEAATETEPRNAVGTGPQDAIDTEPESTVEDGLEDTLDAGQERADETGQEDTSETGTGEE